jgi:hypothetical protein
MTPHEEIKAWLDSENKQFETGYALFVRYSHNRALALYLARKQDLRKLEYELFKIHERPALKEAPVMPMAPVLRMVKAAEDKVSGITGAADVISSAEGKVRIIRDGKVQYEDLPDELKKLYDENTASYKNMRAMHEQMKMAQTDEQRAGKRLMIDSFDDCISRNWKLIDDWAAGKLELDSLNAKQTEEEQYKLINAARTYLSRNTPKMETLEGVKLDKMKLDLRERVYFLRSQKAEISRETLVKLAKYGIIEETDLG